MFVGQRGPSTRAGAAAAAAAGAAAAGAAAAAAAAAGREEAEAIVAAKAFVHPADRSQIPVAMCLKPSTLNPKP